MTTSLSIVCALLSLLGAFVFFCFSPLGFAKKASLALTALGTGCLGQVVFMRYLDAWPMLPMFLGIPFLAFCLGGICLVLHLQKPEDEQRDRLPILLLNGILLFLTAAAVFFPKDYYLPFIRSSTSFAHIFFLAGGVGKALLILAAVQACSWWASQERKGNLRAGLAVVLPWATWGYGFLTLSMFSGEIWSFLGWGMPVVWHDPAIAIAMTLWFFWTCILHLHYLGKCSAACRALLTSLGGLLILFLGCYPDLGPWNPDRLLQMVQ